MGVLSSTLYSDQLINLCLPSPHGKEKNKTSSGTETADVYKSRVRGNVHLGAGSAPGTALSRNVEAWQFVRPVSRATWAPRVAASISLISEAAADDANEDDVVLRRK